VCFSRASGWVVVSNSQHGGQRQQEIQLRSAWMWTSQHSIYAIMHVYLRPVRYPLDELRHDTLILTLGVLLLFVVVVFCLPPNNATRTDNAPCCHSVLCFPVDAVAIIPIRLQMMRWTHRLVERLDPLLHQSPLAVQPRELSVLPSCQHQTIWQTGRVRPTCRLHCCR